MKFRILVVLALVLLVYGCGQKPTEAEQVANKFIQYLVAHDIENAKTLASGNVLYNLTSKENQDITAEILEISVQTLAESNNWAELCVTAKLKLANGDMDMTWCRLDMYNEGTWKVCHVEFTRPSFLGKSASLKQEDMVAVEAVFSDYMQALSSDSRASIKYLVGTARRTQEMALEMLGDTPMVKNVENLSISPLWNGSDILVCRADYILDGRNVKVVVTFAKCDTWKIARVITL